MIGKPLYHGAIAIHGAAPSPDGRLIATTGRGSSNVYLIDTLTKRIVGSAPNPQAGPTTNRERITSGILVGREPHEPTFTRNGKELWVAVRGEDRITILDVAAAIREASGVPSAPQRRSLETLNGPAQVWFSRDGSLAFVVSQKVPRVEVWATNSDANGLSNPTRKTVVDITSQDPPAFTPFLKTTPDGTEVWLSHKLADRVSALSTQEPFRVTDTISLGAMTRPNHVEFVENARRQGRLRQPRACGRWRPRRRRVQSDCDHRPRCAGRPATGRWLVLQSRPRGTWVVDQPEQHAPVHSTRGGRVAGHAQCRPNRRERVRRDRSVEADVRHTDPSRRAGPALRQAGNKKSINLVYVRPGSATQSS